MKREGAKVAVTDLDLAACETVAAEAGPNAKAFALDVADGEAIKRVVTKIAESFGAVSARLRTLSWIAFAALVASIAALALALLR